MYDFILHKNINNKRKATYVLWRSFWDLWLRSVARAVNIFWTSTTENKITLVTIHSELQDFSLDFGIRVFMGPWSPWLSSVTVVIYVLHLHVCLFFFFLSFWWWPVQLSFGGSVILYIFIHSVRPQYPSAPCSMLLISDKRTSVSTFISCRYIYRYHLKAFF